MSIKSTETINWDAILSRLQKVDVEAGVSPLDRMWGLLGPVGKQIVAVAEHDRDNLELSDALYRGYATLLHGLDALQATIRKAGDL